MLVLCKVPMAGQQWAGVGVFLAKTPAVLESHNTISYSMSNKADLGYSTQKTSQTQETE